MFSSRFSYLIFFSVIILLGFNTYAQSTIFEKCGFDHKHDLHLQDTSYQKLIQSSENRLNSYLATPRTRSSNNIYTIPVVVHVLHLGESVGVGTNISDAQIQSAITNLNDVYRGQTANSPVDFEIEFALAQQDPNCLAHNGINRVNASSVPNYLSGGVDYYNDGGEADEDVLKDLSRWPETEYFNIWIVSEIENNNGGFGIQGYANFFTGSAYEGSVMMATVFGYDPTNLQPSFNLNAPRDNSTVVHEIGHYLHLHHTFKGDGDADNNGIGDACPGDVTVGVDSDGCSDTEPHKRYTSQCKSGSLNDCTGAIFNDNSAKNYMSYASCQDRLTNDQKNRSRAMLATSGISLLYSKGDESPNSTSGTLTSANCIPQSSSTATSGGYGGIMNFTIINEFSASSSNTQNDGGYVDFTTECLKTISLQEDSTYNFEITTWYNGHDYKGYIDFNNDGDFLDPNEEVFSGANPPNLNGANGTNTSTGNGTLTIPISNGTNILANTPLRLRIISELTSVTGTITDACYNPFYAQAEDYQLVINQSAATLSADFTANNVNVCLGSSIIFSDASTGNPTSWIWNFGDGNSSTLQNPTHTYSSPGTYNVSLTISDGATTETETKTSLITVSSSVNTQENITACNNYTWNSNTYSISGSYIDTLQTSFGCDSIVTLFLTINNGSNSQENITSCNNFLWNGINYSQSGTYADTLQTIGGCDSIMTLILTINQNETSQENISTCNNYNWNGNTYSQSGSYLDTLQTVNGCDSVITLNLTISNYISSSENISSCNNYFWNGNNYTQSGTYIDTILVAGGCDSIVTLNLLINSPVSSTETIFTCGDYNWNGNNYSQSGNYTDTLQSFLGCDSIVTLNLTLNSSIYSSETIITCDDYNWNGNNYTLSGNYVDTLSSISGCDSIVNLFLTVNYSASIIENITTCDIYNWNGNSYSQSGTYYDSLQTSNGCDSISVLNLIINPSVFGQENITSCNSFLWNGVIYSQTGNYNDTLQTSLGCDSIVTLNLIINNSLFVNDSATACNNFFWNGNNYLNSGLYTDTLSTSLGCDSIVSLHLTILENFILEDSVSACGSYLWGGVLIDSSGSYTDTLQSVNGCDSINILYLNINDNIGAPLTLELLLDDYCLETYWTVKDSQDSIWYNEGPYNCNPTGGGSQANTTIIKDIFLDESECYTFELNDYYGDGLGGSLWGGSDGSWTLKDFNNVIISQGQGDFGYSINQLFYVTQSIASSINNIENSNGQIYIFPNPFKNSTSVEIKNTRGPFNLEIFDMSGRIIKTFNSNSNKFEINNINASSGIYWLRIKNKSNFKPIKLVIE